MYHIGFDIGSSSVKVAIVDATTGQKVILLHEPEEEMEITSLHDNWAEQDPYIWWNYICLASKRAIREANIDASKITTIGISYQMHGLVLVDKNGALLRDAIIWCDSRAIEIGNKAFCDLGKEYCETKLLNSPGNFTASKLKWVQEYEPDVYKRVYKYMLPGDYIAYKLTGNITTTKNGLSEGILWDYQQNDVAYGVLDYYNIDRNLTPEIVENFTNQGVVNDKASKETGLPIGIPVRYRAGDQPNNALSLNVFNPGEIAVTGGTSGVVYAITSKIKPKEVEKVNHFAHVNYTSKKPVIGKLLCINGAGIQFRWLRNLSGIDSYDYMNTLAEKAPVGAEGLVVIPFGNGAERMLKNKNTKTHIANINLNTHSVSHLSRATLEGIAFAFVYGMNLLKKDNLYIHAIRAGNDNLFRSKIFVDTVTTLIDEDIEIYNTTGAVGAARASGVIDDDFSKFEKSVIHNDYIKTYKPLKNIAPYREAYQNWLKELEFLLQYK